MVLSFWLLLFLEGCVRETFYHLIFLFYVWLGSKVEVGVWQPVRVFGRASAIPHLLFANYVLLFLKTNASQVRLMGEVVDSFCRASRLKVNL